MRAATTEALPANARVADGLLANANGAFPAQDGVTLAVGDDFLVKDEGGVAAHVNDGIYTLLIPGGVATRWAARRRDDANTSGKMKPGLTVMVTEGTANGDKLFQLLTDATITLYDTALEFGVFTGGGESENTPTADEKAALAGTSGSPGAGNPYVTDDDARNSDARTPSVHAASHVGGDPIQDATPSQDGLMTAEQAAFLAKFRIVTSGQTVIGAAATVDLATFTGNVGEVFSPALMGATNAVYRFAEDNTATANNVAVWLEKTVNANEAKLGATNGDVSNARTLNWALIGYVP